MTIADREDLAAVIARIAPEHCLALSENDALYREVCGEAAQHFKARFEAMSDKPSDERRYTSLLEAIEFRDGRFRQKLKAAA